MANPTGPKFSPSPSSPTGEVEYPPEVYPDTPPTLSQVLAKWFWRVSVGAVVLSIVAHLSFLAISKFIVVGGGSGGGFGPSEVGMAIINETDIPTQDAAMGEVGTSAPEDLSGPSPELATLSPSVSSDGGGAATELGGVGPISGGGDIAGGAGGLGMGGSGGGGTSFFGLEAKGSRFAFIVDVSGSMSVGSKFPALKAELIKSVVALGEGGQYIIVHFATGADALMGRREWVHSDEPGKRWARQNVTQLQSGGNTNPKPAFDIVFALRPKPEAIFFLTDGEFEPSVAEEVRLMNSEYRIPINTICLETQESQALMQQIAKESGGTFKYVGSATAPGGGGNP
ncbi:MAG: VWA domain-containing protein [Planctomycetes bacterium]|nr:VWA domain-containing protein [Planctomycetota bacterium]